MDVFENENCTMKRQKQATISSFFKRPKVEKAAETDKGQSDGQHVEKSAESEPSPALDGATPIEEDPKEDAAQKDEKASNGKSAGKTDSDKPSSAPAAKKRSISALKGFKSGSSTSDTHDPALRAKFRAKLQLVKRFKGDAVPEDAGEDGEEAEEPEEAPKGKSKKPKVPKLNATENQWFEIKKKHPSTLLFVQVGYKYHIYGEDAEIAHSQTRLFLSPGITNLNDIGEGGVVKKGSYLKLAYSSFPVHRIDFYTKQLVEKGFKVGHVNQMEVAALKNVENKKGPMIRELAKVFTKGTYLDGAGSADDSAASGYLLALHESDDAKPLVTMLAVDVATGDVVWDSFKDDYMKSELEIRLLTLSPCEILTFGVTESTEKMCQKYIHRLKGRLAAVELSEDERCDPEAGVATYFASQEGASASAVLSLPDMVQSLILGTANYLVECKLDSLFLLTKNFNRYSGDYMRLTANTVSSLELFANSTDNKVRGSLFWVLNKCLTPFGSRLLKKWISRPLVDRVSILKRLTAVEEIMASHYSANSDRASSRLIEKLISVLKPIPDLSKLLMKLHYGQLDRKGVYLLLRELLFVAREYESDSGEIFADTNPMLHHIFNSLGVLKSQIEAMLSEINADSAREDDAINFFVSDPESILARKQEVSRIQAQFSTELESLRAELNRPRLQYTTVAGIEYLIEVSLKDSKKVPLEWIKMSGTKTVARFRTPELNSLVKGYEYAVEKLKADAEEEFQKFSKSCAAHYEGFREMVAALAEFDCLFSLAQVSSQSGFVKPEYIDSGDIVLLDSRHVITERLMTGYVSNDINISGPTVVTGPNMGGKSSLVRQVALSVIMAHIGCYVPASKAIIPMTDAILCRMGAQDNIMSGQSTFMVELCECAEILRFATSRSLVLLDEIGRGTTTTDGIAIAHSVLKHFIELRTPTLFITHYPLGQLLDSEDSDECALFHMDIALTDPPVFTYKMKRGSAAESYGLNAARLAGIPPQIIARASEKGQVMKNEVLYDDCMRMLREISGKSQGGV